MTTVIHILSYIYILYFIKVNSSDPLIVTPLLDTGEYLKAQDASRVNLAQFGNDASYAAYFQTSASDNSNLFFWFFPSRNDPSNDPIILCLQGGPGISSLFMLFLENGPYVINEMGEISNRLYSWTNYSSILYIDSPFGTGFSFSDAGTEATDLETITYHLDIAVEQFFKLFPNLITNNMYLMGESYGGKYIPALGYTLHSYNLNTENPINFKGIIIGNGLTDPKNQNGMAEYLSQLGLIDDTSKRFIETLEQRKSEQITNQDYAGAYATYGRMLQEISQKTGFEDLYNYLSATSLTSAQEAAMDIYLNGKEVKEALHVGSKIFVTYNGSVAGYLTDFFKPIPQTVSFLLQNNYKVLIYNGQVDIMIPYPSVVHYLKLLSFPGSNEYIQATKRIWRVNGDIAGYVKKGGNLYEVLVRNAGHNVPKDQPEWAYHLIRRFIFNEPMWD